MNLARVVRNAASLTAMRGVTAIASFALLVYLTRRWPGQVLGEFSTLNAIALMMLPLPLLGVHVALIRDVVAAPERTAELGSSALAFAGIVATVAALGIGTYVVLAYPRSMWTAGWLVALSALPTAYTIVNDSLLLARERMTLWARIAVVEVVLRTAAWALLAWLGLGITACFAAFFALRCGAAVAYRVLAADAPLLVPGAVVRAQVLRMFRLVPDFAGILVATTLMQRLDFLMLSRLASMESVAAYAAPYRVFEAIQTVPTVLAMALFPSLARAAAAPDGGAVLGRIVRRCAWVIALLGVPGALVLFVIASPLTQLLFGQRFAGAGTVLAWLAPVPLVFAADQMFSSALQSARQQRADVRVWAAGVTLYAASLWVLVPRHGAVGAAMATLLSVAVAAALRLVTARRIIPVRDVLQPVPRVAGAGLAMAASLWALRGSGPLLALAVAIPVYVLALVLLGAVRKTDLSDFRDAFSRREVPA